MLQFTAMMEGTYFTAARGEVTWSTKTVDCMTGKEFNIEMTDQELGAVLACSAAGDFGEDDGGLLDLLYAIAEKVQPQSKEDIMLRMIP
jgi:hypothetical protein